jgi:hypothetical protein
MTAFYNEHIVPLLKTTRLKDKEAKRKACDARWREVKRIVDTRDSGRCRACGRRTRACMEIVADRREHHHVRPRRKGRLDETSEVAILCKSCHDDRHVTRTLHITGNADATLTFEKDGRTWNG